ncbi:LysR family transcriptional regulator [Enterobacter sp. KB-221C9]|uniref:LysR family transcriptional regulator n=1 Tax=Enterobacter sp. KB-221C9 TaxID=3242496 RepID=UPI0035226FA2
MIDDIRYLIVFAQIAEAGSISGGAEALGLTTATASTHLSKLEKNLGCALLYRNTRKLSLTHDGANLLETANFIGTSYYTTRKKISDLTRDIQQIAPWLTANEARKRVRWCLEIFRA